ncbi:hypothetical protein HNR03_001681 [Pseudomonas sp. JAI111]|nr:hypothetical protein [Pseudomonas sp. JAI111]
MHGRETRLKPRIVAAAKLLVDNHKLIALPALEQAIYREH